MHDAQTITNFLVQTEARLKANYQAGNVFVWDPRQRTQLDIGVGLVPIIGPGGEWVGGSIMSCSQGRIERL